MGPLCILSQKIEEMTEADMSSLDDLLEEIQHLSRRDEQQRSPFFSPVEGSDVILNVYNMVSKKRPKWLV